ncbi:hypothetical protein CCACVL1_00774, partial [Corchorus capsularis]
DHSKSSDLPRYPFTHGDKLRLTKSFIFQFPSPNFRHSIEHLLVGCGVSPGPPNKRTKTTKMD